MAVVQCLPVRSAAHLHNLIDYVQQGNKTMDKDFVFCSGCQLDTAYRDFSMVKKLTGKQGGILAHQIIQSFAVGEVSVEQAHEISKQLAERTLQGYQYTVCTHMDKNHIHSHIVINSVNQITGDKYHSNLKSLAVLRDASDDLCREYGLSVIKQKTGLKGLDKTTYEMARQGKSWKVRLANHLDGAIAACKTKAEFNHYLEKLGYGILWTNKNITIKYGEYRIRLDTLAKQFGPEYMKANIEKALGLSDEGKEIESFLKEVPASDENSELSKIEKQIIKRENLESDVIQDNIFAAQKAEQKFAGLRACCHWVKDRMIVVAAQLRGTLFRKPAAPRYVKAEEQPARRPHERFGNISKRKLINSYGETSTLYIKPSQMPIMAALGIFYSGTISERGAAVSFKAQHNGLVAAALGISVQKIKSVTERENERKENQLIKQMSKAENKELYRVTINGTQAAALQASGIPCAWYRNETEYKTIFFRDDLKQVAEACGLDYQAELKKIERQDNMRNYIAIKSQAARKLGENVEYRIVDARGLGILRENNFNFAFFEKGDKYNVVFLQSQSKEYERILKKKQKAEKDQYRSGGKVHHR